MAKSEPGDEMYAAVGRAITMWGSFESQLATLFAVCISPSDGTYSGPHGALLLDSEPPLAAFFAVENFRSKLKMVDDTARARFKRFSNTEELLARWTKLHDKARKLSLKRNKLAHWYVIGMAGDQRLVPNVFSPAGHYASGNSLTLHQLHHLETAFRLLLWKTKELAMNMTAHPELLSRYAKIAAHQLDSARRRRNQTAIELLERALASPE